jgi:hypothetical protein
VGEDRPHSSPLNLLPNLGNIVQGLPAKRASKMAKEDQQNRRLIHQIEQGSAGFRAVPLKHSGHVRRLRIRLSRI